MRSFASAVFLTLLAPTASSAGIFGVTADGTWDCTDNSDVYLGAIVLADESYAFIKPDGLFGGYGKTMRLTENTDLPQFAVIDGYLKDELGASALALQGPREDIHDMTGELFLYIAVTVDEQFQCLRRKMPGSE